MPPRWSPQYLANDASLVPGGGPAAHIPNPQTLGYNPILDTLNEFEMRALYRLRENPPVRIPPRDPNAPIFPPGVTYEAMQAAKAAQAASVTGDYSEWKLVMLLAGLPQGGGTRPARPDGDTAELGDGYVSSEDENVSDGEAVTVLPDWDASAAAVCDEILDLRDALDPNGGLELDDLPRLGVGRPKDDDSDNTLP